MSHSGLNGGVLFSGKEPTAQYTSMCLLSYCQQHFIMWQLNLESWSYILDTGLRNRRQEKLFFTFCWMCISLWIFANNQLDALFHVFIYLISLHVSSITVLIIGRSNCINTSSGMISLCKWLLVMPVRRELVPSWLAYQTVTYTG